jgi:hypothetical protein
MVNTLLLEVAIVGRRFGGARGIIGLDRLLLLLELDLRELMVLEGWRDSHRH